MALEALKKEGEHVTIYSDSKYVVDSVEKKWVFGWEKKYFSGKKNPDLWMRFLRIYRKHHVKFVWVKGHASNAENKKGEIKIFIFSLFFSSFSMLIFSR